MNNPIKPICIFDKNNILDIFRTLDKKLIIKDLNISDVCVDLPQLWKIRAEDLGIDTSQYIWSFYKNINGEPINIFELWLLKFGNQIANRIYVLKNS